LRRFAILSVAFELKDRMVLSFFAGGSTRLSQPPTPEEKTLGRRCLLRKHEGENCEDVGRRAARATPPPRAGISVDSYES
jgi:hypothetical protein